MASGRRVFDATLVFVCYVMWTGVLLGVAGVGGLWLIGRLRGDTASSSSTYQVLEDNALLLLGGAGALAAGACALSFWVDRHTD